MNSVRCHGTLEFRRIVTKLRVNLEHSLEEKETSGLCSSAQPFHFLIARGEEVYGHWAHKGKMGRSFFFSFLNSLQSERWKGILETGKGFTPERMYTEKLRASVESHC